MLHLAKWILVGCLFVCPVASYASWTMESAGGFSQVHIYTPSTPTSPIGDGRSLLIVLHGCGQAASAYKGANLEDTAEEFGMVIAAPEARHKAGWGCWDWWNVNKSRTFNDYANLLGLAEELGRRDELGIDTNQIYVTGLSAGGVFAMQAACLAPDVFAGFGLIGSPSGGVSANGSFAHEGTPQSAATSCKSFAGSYAEYFDTQVMVSAWGDSDGMVPRSYGPQNAKAMSIVYTGTDSVSREAMKIESNRATETLYANDRVSQLELHGDNHGWPGGSGASGSFILANSINYGSYLADFFARNNMRVSGSLNVRELRYSPSYVVIDEIVEFSVIVQGPDPVTSVELLVDGLVEGSFVEGSSTGEYVFDWDTAGLSPGDYEVRVFARDSAGNGVESPSRTLRINEYPSDCSFDDWDAPEGRGFHKVDNFGENPGNLKMFLHIPEDMPPNAPVVMALHGCNQNFQILQDENTNALPTGHADQFRLLSGWTDLADEHKFYVIFPEQIVRSTRNVNDSNQTGNHYACFNWAGFFGKNFSREEHPEGKSLLAMIDYVASLADGALDRNSVYLTGFSGGAAMTNTMLAFYPDIFAGGAPMAGVPFNCALHDHETGQQVPHADVPKWVSSCMGVLYQFPYNRTGNTFDVSTPARFDGTPALHVSPSKIRRSPDVFRRYVHEVGHTQSFQNPSFNPPRVLIWQGGIDQYVAAENMHQQIKQWGAVHGFDEGLLSPRDGTPWGAVESRIKQENSKHTYYEWTLPNESEPRMGAVYLPDMAHGIAVDPGQGDDQGGEINPFSIMGMMSVQWSHNMGIHSTYYTAQWWGILDRDLDQQCQPGPGPGNGENGSDNNGADNGSDNGVGNGSDNGSSNGNDTNGNGASNGNGSDENGTGNGSDSNGNGAGNGGGVLDPPPNDEFDSIGCSSAPTGSDFALLLAMMLILLGPIARL